MAVLKGATGISIAVILTVHDSALHSLLNLKRNTFAIKQFADDTLAQIVRPFPFSQK